MKRRDLLRYLRQYYYCRPVREGREHSIWVYPTLEKRVSMPRHRELANFTVARICRKLGVPLIHGLQGQTPEFEFPPFNDLEELRTLLAERVQEWTQQWEQQGIQKGLEQGRRQGASALLLRLLECKFGTLDPTTQEWVMAADVDTLSRWGENLLTATTLEQVWR